MRDFRIERRDKKADRRKLTARIRRLTWFMAWHYILLAISGVNTLLALFAILNTNAPWRPAMLALCAASFVLSAYLLLANVGK